MSPRAREAGYVVPTYVGPDQAPWYHFLHGNVPGHQIDFMYRAEVPQGPLTRQHFSHLARLMKYIEPQAGCSHAFAIGNLSRDDTQHEPGHGGVALMFGLRIQGITDHAGRQDPPFAHGVAAIDRELDRAELLAAAGVFHRHVLAAAQSAEWYRSYVHCAAERPAGMKEALAKYVAGFDDLPSPPPSSLELKWTVGESTPPSRIVIVHDDDAPFGVIAACAAKIAAVLFPSDIRWSAISSGREADLPNGVTVRLVAASNVTAADEARGVHRIDAVPDDEEEIARQLFGAASATAVAKPVTRGWRDEYAGASAGNDEGAVDTLPPSFARGASTIGRTPVAPEPAATPFEGAATAGDRAGVGITAHRAIDVEPGPASPVEATLAQPHPSPPFAPARSAAETATLSAELAQPALKAALPFTPAPTPLPPASTNDADLGPPLRSSSRRWKGAPIGLGSAAILVVVLYLVLRGDREDPTAHRPPPPPPNAASAPAPTTALIPTVVPAPTVPLPPTVALTPTVAPTPTVARKATAPTPSSLPLKPGPRPTPTSIFDGPLTK